MFNVWFVVFCPGFWECSFLYIIFCILCYVIYVCVYVHTHTHTGIYIYIYIYIYSFYSIFNFSFGVFEWFRLDIGFEVFVNEQSEEGFWTNLNIMDFLKTNVFLKK